MAFMRTMFIIAALVLGWVALRGSTGQAHGTPLLEHLIER